MAMPAVMIEIIPQSSGGGGGPTNTLPIPKKLTQTIKQAPHIQELIFITVRLLKISHNRLAALRRFFGGKGKRLFLVFQLAHFFLYYIVIDLGVVCAKKINP